MEVKAMWSASTPAHLGTALLKSMKTAIRDELFRRFSTFPYSSPIIASFAHIFSITPSYHILHYKADFFPHLYIAVSRTESMCRRVKTGLSLMIEHPLFDIDRPLNLDC